MSKRRSDVDILKAFGIILMVVGHMFPNTTIDKWLHAFHMPMFFIVSGYLFKKTEKTRTAIYRRVRTLLFPYVFFASVHLIVIFIFLANSGNLFENIKSFVYHIIWMNHEGLPICGAIWFLTAFFVSNVLYIILNSYVRNDWFRVCLVIIFAVIGIILPRMDIRLPFSADVGLMGVSLFLLGNKIDWIVKKLNYPLCISIIIACSILSLLNSNVNLRLGEYGNIFLFYINCYFMTCSLWFLATKINSNSKIGSELTYIGRNSIVYLGFNQLILIIFKNIQFGNALMSYTYKIIAVIGALLCLHIVSLLFEKTKLGVILGRK